MTSSSQRGIWGNLNLLQSGIKSLIFFFFKDESCGFYIDNYGVVM